jgi:hypothetical protein
MDFAAGLKQHFKEACAVDGAAGAGDGEGEREIVFRR